MKKVLFVLLLFFPLVTLAQSYPIGEFYFDLDRTNKTATIVNRSGKSYEGDIVIPETVEYGGVKYTVTTIGKNCFHAASGLFSVVIPNTITKIEEYAFSNATSLTTLRIPNTVKTIGKQAFEWCNSLRELDLGTGVTSLGGSCITDCHSLAYLKIPNNVVRMGSQAISSCYGLKTLVIGSGLTEIGSNGFILLTHIKDVYCLGKNIPYNGANIWAFSSTDEATLHVPESSIETYINSPYWGGKFKNIVALTAEEEQTLGVKDAVLSRDNVPVGRYNLNGTKATDSQHGIIIEKMKDGTTRKVIK